MNIADFQSLNFLLNAFLNSSITSPGSFKKILIKRVSFKSEK